ncbi:MAG: thioredoxin domain-containing protein, partial [Candidatus Altiarchaeales archaeon]|nr:thioredoxin domain-containing protein [Candidatus Altiarchaeales archaeon]
MANEENEELEQPKTEAEKKEETNKEAKKKPRKKKSTKKKTAKKASSKKSTAKKEDDQTTFSLDMLIAGLLVLSVLLNFYMFYQTGQLKAEIETLTQQLVSQKQGGHSTTPADTAGEDADKAELTFYVMSQCPYGTQVLDSIAPVLEQAGDYVDFKVDYIATEQSDGSFKALHGQSEVEGNIVQLCAAKYHPQNYKYMDMIVCMDENARNIPDNWEECARQANLDVEKIRSCYEGEEGKELLSESAKRAQQAQASGSPTIYLNGEIYG